MRRSQLSIDLVFPNGGKLGPAKIALLEAIVVGGSLTQAARALGVSYRSAWKSLQSINSMFRSPAVATTAGGYSRGGSVLTPTGTEVVALYHAIQSRTLEASTKELRALEALARTDVAHRRGKKWSLLDVDERGRR